MFDDDTGENDIALVTLKHSGNGKYIEFNAFAQPLCLPSGTNRNDSCQILPSAPLSQGQTVRIVDCADDKEDVSSICVIGLHGTLSLDNGTPLICKDDSTNRAVLTGLHRRDAAPRRWH